MGFDGDSDNRRRRHDKVVRGVNKRCEKAGYDVVFTDLKGHSRPDSIYMSPKGDLIVVDYKTRRGKLVKVEHER